MMGLAILNVAAGDTKITFDKSNPAERERACAVVKDMLSRGYAILVKVGERDGRPIFMRATEFDPETAEYIVVGVPDALGLAPAAPAAEPKPKRVKTRLPADKTPAVGVARSAGGMSRAANSIEAENMRNFDNHADVRAVLAVAADRLGHWAGIPMPLEGHPLVIEPRYPRAAHLMKIGRVEEKGSSEKLRNVFYSNHLHSDVVIYEDGGKVKWGVKPAFHSGAIQLQTLGASLAWGLEQEANALTLLAQLVRHHQFKQYLLTGTFLELSKRSGVMYAFRKLRPTIALSMRNGNEPSILCTLCMHPIAYYEGSWAGAMCPTDDVIAHLMLMRGDERMFWRRSNQHPSHRPEAGL